MNLHYADCRGVSWTTVTTKMELIDQDTSNFIILERKIIVLAVIARDLRRVQPFWKEGLLYLKHRLMQDRH